ncbi:MAG: TM0996/MTH895 family glutaredoxin-like protein [Thermoplasmatales archaeon]|nr:TM0996/MTH895 family glutaredoxin-like protein [Thermoplasmatales archaeon]
MKIEIFGTGCAKCKALEKRVREAVEEIGRDIEIVKIEDIGEIINRGVIATPALAIDGKIKVAGRIPSKEEIKEMIG